jgi:hypothetical protein
MHPVIRLVRPSIALVLLAMSTGCEPVPATNPYDEATPRDQQAPGEIRGELELVEAGAPVSELAAELRGAQLTLRSDGDEPLLGSDGAPVQAALSMVEGEARGSFRFVSVPTGTWSLEVAGLGTRFTGPPMSSVRVGPGGSVSLGRLRWVSQRTEAGGPGRVAGRVRLEGGAGATRRATLYRRGSDGIVEVAARVADDVGEFAFSGLSVGTYALVAEAPGFTPDYRLDFKVGETEGARLEYAFTAEQAMVLHPVTAVLLPILQRTEGTYYTAERSAEIQVLAFGAVTGMRLSTDRTFSDAAGELLPFEPYSATKTVLLPEEEGAITVWAQFEARSADGFVFLSPLFSTTIVRDATPPVIERADALAIRADAQGVRWVLQDAAVVALELDGFDRHSAVAGILVKQPEDNRPGVPDGSAFDLVSSPGGLVRLNRTIGLTGGDGEKVAFVWLRDRAGNQSEPVAVRFAVDTRDPAVPLVAENSVDGVLRSRTALLSFDTSGTPVEDLPVWMQVGTRPLSLGAPRQAFGTSIPLDFAAAHGQAVTFVARLTDAAGRVAEVESPTYLMDLSGAVRGRVSLEGVPALVASNAGANVRLYGSGAEPGVDAALAETSTDAEGRFAFAAVPEGDRYRIAVSRDGYEALESGLAPVVAGAATLAPAMSLRFSRGALAGRFVLEDRVGSTSEHGGIVVVATLTGGRPLTLTGVTEPSGAWRLEGVPATAGDERWALDGQAGGYRRSSAGRLRLLPGETGVANADAAGQPVPVPLPRAAGDFDLCSVAGPCVPLAYTNGAVLKVALRSEAGVTDLRVRAREAFADDATAPAWQGGFDPARPVTVDVSGPDGTVDVYAQVRVDGVAGPVMRASVVLDTVAPLVSAVVIEASPDALDPAFTNQRRLRVRADASAGEGAPLDGVRLSFAAAAPPGPSATDARCEAGLACELPLPSIAGEVAEGRHDLWAFACDLAGNCSPTPGSAAIIYDRTPPSTGNGVAIRPDSQLILQANGVRWTRSGQYDVALSVGAAKSADGAPVTDLAGSPVADVYAARFGLAPDLSSALFASVEPRPEPQGVVNVGGPVIGPLDGLYTVYGQLRDAAGNVTSLDPSPFTFSLTLDTQAPGVAFSLADDAPVTSLALVPLTVALASTDAAVRVELATDGGRFQSVVSRPLPLLGDDARLALPAGSAPAGDGTYTVHARFYDAAGNMAERQDSIRLDRTPPDILRVECTSCTTFGNQLYTNSETQQVSLATFATDLLGRVSSVAVSVDGGARTSLPYTGVSTLTLPAQDGEHLVSVEAIDDAGNASAPQVLSIVLDRVAPRATVTVAGGALYTRQPSVLVEITGADSLSPIAGYRLSNSATLSGAVLPFSERVNWTLSAPETDGEKTVQVEVVDAAGNVARASDGITLDTAAPTGTVTLAGGADVVAGRLVSVELSYSAETRGWAVASGALDCGSATYSDAGGSPEMTTVPFPAGDGAKTLVACFRDAAGNTSSATDSVVLDTTAPGGTVLVDAGAAYALSRTVVVAIDATSDTTLMAVAEGTPACDGLTFTTLQTSVALLLTADGERTVTVCLRDAAGNTGRASDDIVVDTANPAGTLVISRGLTAVNSAEVELSLAGVSADVTQMAVTNGTLLDCATASYEPFAATRSFTLSGGDGTRTVTGCLRDAAGRTGQVQDTIVLDTQKPVGSLTLAGGSAWSRSTAVSARLAYSADVISFAVAPGAIDCASATYATASGTSTTTTITLAGEDGLKLVSACLRDLAGNTSLVSGSISLDRTGPVALDVTCASCTRSGEVRYSNAADRTLALSLLASDNLGTVSKVRTRHFDGLLGQFTVVEQAYAAEISLQLPDADGSYDIDVSFVDPAGNVGGVLTTSVTLDRVAPANLSLLVQGTIADGRRSSVLTRTIDVELTAAATGSAAVQFSNDILLSSAAWQSVGTAPVPWLLVPGDGTKTVYARFRDVAGNVSGTASVTIVLDTTPPGSPTILLAGGRDYVKSSLSVPVTLSAIGATQFQSSTTGVFDGTWQTYASSTTVNLPSGDGIKSAFVIFRDSAGNETAAAVGRVVLDTMSPVMGTPSVAIGKNTGGFINTLAAIVSFQVTGADEMRVACDGALNTETWMAFAPTFTCLLPPGDGQKLVVAEFRDFAWNTVENQSDTVLLDTTPPGSPVVSSASTVTSAASFSVALGVSSSDAAVTSATPLQQFVYQLRGGQYREWTDCGTTLPRLAANQDSTCSGPPFAFQLQLNRDNRLSVRARDRAGNLSAEDTVSVRHDDTPPGVPRMQLSSVSSADWSGSANLEAGEGYIVASWEPPADADVAGYRLYYGYINGADKTLYTGSFANEGGSPIDTGRPCEIRAGENDCRFTLTGLPNGTQIWINVAAYDRTELPSANESALPGSGGAITPFQVAPRVVGTLSTSQLGAVDHHVRGLAARDGLAYVTLARSGFPGRFVVVDVANPKSPTLLGTAQDNLGPASLERGYEVYLQGRYAYVADGTAGLRTIDVSDPRSPKLVDTDGGLGTGQFARALAGQGDLIVVAVTTSAASPDGHLRIYSIAPGGCGATSGPANPCLVSTYRSANSSELRPLDVAFEGNLVVAATGSARIMAVDLSDPLLPRASGSCLMSAGTNSVALSGTIAYYSSGVGVGACDYSNPVSPVDLANAAVSSARLVWAVRAHANLVYLRNEAGMELFENEISAAGPVLEASGYLDAPRVEETAGTGFGYFGEFAVDGNYAYLASGRSGLAIARVAATRALQVESTFRPRALNSGYRDGLVSGHHFFATGAGFLEATFAHRLSPTKAAETVGGAQSGELARAGDLLAWTDWSSVAWAVHLSLRRFSHSGFTLPTGGGSVTLPDGFKRSYGLDIQWPYAYVVGTTTTSNRSDTVRTVDLRGVPAQVSSTALTPASALDVGISGRSVAGFGHLYVANGTSSNTASGLGQVEVYGLTNPAQPARVSTLLATNSPGGGAWGGGIIDLVLQGSLLYACGYNGFSIFSLAQSPSQPLEIGGKAMPSANFKDCAISGNLLYLASNSGVALYDVTDPASPKHVGFHGFSVDGETVVPAGNLFFVNNQFRESQIIRLK